jgi:mono/diheme cytochrome c family protein
MMRAFTAFLFFSILAAGAPSCTGGQQEDKYAGFDQRTSIRLKQYMREGRKLYTQHCSNCHQDDGTGLARLYPPLKDSDYMLNNKADVLCGMRYGQKGEIMVNGVLFNQEMPANSALTDLDIAEIATYVYNAFTDTAVFVSVKEAEAILRDCPEGGM